MKHELSNQHFLILAVLILIASFFIRIFNLSSNPPGFFADEAAIGYNAYSLLKTGADEYHKSFPIFFRSFGDYRLPIPIYANLPFIAILGLSEVSVRMTTIFFGLVSILFLMLFVRELRGNLAGVCVGVLLMVLPWHIHLSRWGSEYMSFPAFLSISLYGYSVSVKRPRMLLLSFAFFALTLYTYYPTLFVTPLFMVGLVMYRFLSLKKERGLLLISCIAFFLICLPLLFALKNGTLITRWNSVQSQKVSVSQKAIQALTTYKDAYTPDFLFLKGDVGMPEHAITRHSVRGFGELYLFQIILIPVGLFLALRKSKNGDAFLMLWLLLLYPLGSALTSDGILSTRSVIGIIPLSFFSAIGLAGLVIIMLKKFHALLTILLLSVFALIMLFSSGMYLRAYYRDYPLYSADFWGWQEGPKYIMQYFLANKDRYDDLYMSGEYNSGEIFLKFYDPTNICSSKCKMGDFMRQPELYNPARKQLFALSPEYIAQSPLDTRFKTLHNVYYPNGTVAFKIGVIVYPSTFKM
ncbi:MAG: glycosyltransferase family 39 protein [Candidatus Levybacteria bacterium]|nr:glycosyltransferase family 39 protein [Candidatus Levybacteria bacterium]